MRVSYLEILNSYSSRVSNILHSLSARHRFLSLSLSVLRGNPGTTMADKPSRGLVLYADGLARFIDPSHTHLHSLASKANCGFLTLPNAPSSECEDDRIIREFAYLLDAAEAYISKTSGEINAKAECQSSSLITTISERFMGMKAALITTKSSLKSFAGQLGLTVFQPSELLESGHSLLDLPVDAVASELLKLLGFQEGKKLEMGLFDLVFVHIGAGEEDNGEKGRTINSYMGYINSLVGHIMHVAQPGSEIGPRLHLSVIMSYGSVSDADNLDFSVLVSDDKRNSDFSALFPRQSFTMKGEKQRDDVRHCYPMLMAQWQYGVTRKDLAETFSFKDFKEHGGNLAIPVDRFLHEVAFKLWKAPKYGA